MNPLFASRPSLPGDPGAEIAVLVRTYRPVADHLVREAATRLPGATNLEPLHAAASGALQSSAASFVRSRGTGTRTTFGQFATAHIRSAIAEALRAQLAAPANPGAATGVGTELAAAVAALPELERTVLLGYFYEQRAIAELATALGRTQAEVLALRTLALARLRAIRSGTDTGLSVVANMAPVVPTPEDTAESATQAARAAEIAHRVTASLRTQVDVASADEPSEIELRLAT